MGDKCQAGCMVFTGGDMKHDENCVFYKESFTKLIRTSLIADQKKENEDNEKLKEALIRSIKYLPLESNLRNTIDDLLKDKE